MAKIQKMANGGMMSLGSLASGINANNSQVSFAGINGVPGTSMTGPQFGLSGGGGGSAQEGLGQVQDGASMLGNALNTASSALGGGGSGGQFARAEPQGSSFKKGGSAKKYSSGGKINLKDCGVSTAQKSKTNSNG